jgi:hypothetical protein
MSCGSCGKLPKGSFSPLEDTWNKRSSLNMNSWDPYPELLPKVERDAQRMGLFSSSENYCNCSNGDCGKFKNIQDVVDVGNNFPTPLYRTATISASRFNERYVFDNRLKNPFPYDTLNQAWKSQKPYQL